MAKVHGSIIKDPVEALDALLNALLDAILTETPSGILCVHFADDVIFPLRRAPKPKLTFFTEDAPPLIFSREVAHGAEGWHHLNWGRSYARDRRAWGRRPKSSGPALEPDRLQMSKTREGKRGRDEKGFDKGD